jgi:beta-glucanase (GH16 family)
MKNKFIVLIFIFTLGCMKSSQSSSIQYTNIDQTPSNIYTLVWADEFDQPDGSPPDPTKWNYSTGGGGWGNSELEYYTDSIENSYIKNEMLVIEAQKDRYMGCDYTSARLNSLVKGSWKYGRIEIRAKLPNTQGIWPAIWMLPTNITHYGSWPVSGEIDIMELVGKEPGSVYGTLHFGNPHTQISTHYDLPTDYTFADGFHIFILDWQPTQISWYVDGNLYQTANQWFTSMEDSPFPAPFDVEFYLIMNVAVGGNWPGRPNSTSVFPQRMYIDYIRIYQEY